MESELVKRRIHTITAHFTSTDDNEISPSHLLPMNCSGSVNSMFRRHGNNIYFASQASSPYGYCMMRHTSLKKGGSTSFVAPKTNGAKCEAPSNHGKPPCFAKPTRNESIVSNSVAQSMTKAQDHDFYAYGPPTFARPSKQIKQEELLNNEKRIPHPEIGKWSPRLDVAESKGNYVIRVEVPGASVDDIRVEVDEQKLSIKGRRSSSSWKVAGCPNGCAVSSYLKREIPYGPFEVEWPLPTGVNKDNISAEFLDGFLQVIIPKV